MRVLALLISLFSSLPSFSASFSEDGSALPVRVLDVVQETGCGARPPRGHEHECQKVTTRLTIAVHGKKGCFKPTDFSVSVTEEAMLLIESNSSSECPGGLNEEICLKKPVWCENPVF